MGSKAPTTTIVQPPPPTVTQLPQPNVAENSRQLYESQLQYNPLLAQSEYNLQAQYGPLYKALYEQNLPYQSQGLETLAQQATQRLTSPTGLTPEQQMAQDAIRQRAYEQSARGIRESANVGGTLYGGRREEREDRSRNELAQAFATQDIGLQQQNRQQTLQELIASLQAFFPQIQQFTQGVTPSPDALMNAIQQSTFVQPAAIGFGPSRFSRNAGLISGIAQGVGSAAGAAAMACHVAEVLYGVDDPRTLLARLYVWTHESPFLRLYRQSSQRWALWLKRLPFLKPLVQPIWDRMHRAMRVELRAI